MRNLGMRLWNLGKVTKPDIKIPQLSFRFKNLRFMRQAQRLWPVVQE